eukprot:1161034-Pelagomonas_calceolata.AAC.12
MRKVPPCLPGPCTWFGYVRSITMACLQWLICSHPPPCNEEGASQPYVHALDPIAIAHNLNSSSMMAQSHPPPCDEEGASQPCQVHAHGSLALLVLCSHTCTDHAYNE